MKIRLKNIKAFSVLLLFTMLIRFQSYLSEPFISDDIFMMGFLGIMSLWLLATLFRVDEGRLNKNLTMILFFLFIVYLLLFGVFFKNETYSVLISQNLKQYVVWTLLVFFVTWFTIRYKCYEQTVKILYFAVSILAVVLYIIYFDNFGILKNLGNIFVADTSARYRQTFGFSHANNCADFCLLGISLSLLLRSMFVKKNIFWFFTDIVKVIMLISTSSRGNIIGLFILLCGYVYVNIEYILKKVNKKQLRYLKRGFIFICIIGIITYLKITKTIDFTELLVMSNRSYNFSINIPILFSSDRLLYGIGFVASSAFGTNAMHGSFTFVDNFYLYVLLSTGIIGCIMMGIIIFVCLNGLIMYKNKLSQFYKCLLVIQFMQLFIAFFESEIFTHVFPSSCVYSIILFSVIGDNDNLRRRRVKMC